MTGIAFAAGGGRPRVTAIGPDGETRLYAPRPALRMLFMAPSDRFRMRDGVVSLLAGNLSGTWDLVIPVLTFKSVYFALSLLPRLGFKRPPDDVPAAPIAGAALKSAGT